MPAPVLSGPQYLREGLKLVLSPGLRLFVLLPLLINLVLFVGLIYFAGHQFSLWVDTLMPSLPSWLSFLNYLLWPLFVVLVALMVFFTFTMLANIIAAPFNGFLAEKSKRWCAGVDNSPPFSWGELIAMVPRTLAREMRKLGYFLPRAIALLILSFVPVLNLIAAPLWLIFGGLDDGYPVHRLPGGQPQTGLERNARLAARKALAEPEFWRDRVSGVADTCGQYPDDAGRCRRRDPVLGAGAW